MRIIYIPQDPEVWIVVGIVLLGILCVAIYQSWRPPLKEKVLGDARYHQALEVYVANLPADTEPTWEDRQRARAVAAEFLTHDHGVAATDADKHLGIVIAEYAKGQSYEWRNEAIIHEQNGAYDLALDCFERAARLQEEHDKEDHQFLQRCIARVRSKVRPR